MDKIANGAATLANKSYHYLNRVVITGIKFSPKKIIIHSHHPKVLQNCTQIYSLNNNQKSSFHNTNGKKTDFPPKQMEFQKTGYLKIKEETTVLDKSFHEKVATLKDLAFLSPTPEGKTVILNKCADFVINYENKPNSFINKENVVVSETQQKNTGSSTKETVKDVLTVVAAGATIVSAGVTLANASPESVEKIKSGTTLVIGSGKDVLIKVEKKIFGRRLWILKNY